VKHICFIILLLIKVSQAHTQAITNYNLKPILREVSSVDIADNNFDDLLPIKNAIGKSRIVVLGEQDHGDATSMAAKARLVRFLHQKMGFKVLAFEADMYSLLSLQNEGMQPFYLDSVRKCVAPYWSQTKDMDALWQYMAANKDLEIAGFDIGLSTNYAKRNFDTELYPKLDVLPYANTEGYKAFKKTLSALLQAKPAKEFVNSEREVFFKSLTELTIQAKQVYATDELLQRQLLAAGAKAEYYWLRNYREKHMAANLSWLLKYKYPNEKVIVWTASFHAVKDIYAVVEKNIERAHYYSGATDKDSVEPMIQIIRRDSVLSETIYALNMVGLSGTYTPTAWTSIHNAVDSIHIPVGNLERLVADLNSDYHFLDLKSLPKDHWLQQPVPMIAILHRNTYVARWARVFDGLFFIKNMQPLTPL
jgi:erythromycin esterase